MGRWTSQKKRRGSDQGAKNPVRSAKAQHHQTLNALTQGLKEPKIFERQDIWTVGTPKGRAQFGPPKPKPNFDWDDLDRALKPSIPETAIGIRDIMEHFNVRTSRAQQLAAEGVRKGLLRRIAKGWYMRP